MEQYSILIIEEDKIFAETLAQALISGIEGQCRVEICSNAEQADPWLEQGRIDLLVASYDLPGEEGLSLLSKVEAQSPGMAMILLAGEECPEPAAQKMVGNRSCLTRPFDILDFLLIVRQVLFPLEQPPPRNGNSRLLILEDDDGLRRIYSLALSKFENCQIDEAATMQAARSLLDNQDYDVFICDIRIGRDRATDILLEYKHKLSAYGTKIVMCSAFGQYRNLPEEVDHFLEKPISVDKLVTLVGQLVGCYTSGHNKK